MERWQIVLIIAIGILLYHIWRKLMRAEAKREAAREAYHESLQELKRHPTDADLWSETLALWREYSDLTRSRKDVAIFDEVGLVNDLVAAAGGTAAPGPTGGARPAGRVTSRSLEERLAELGELHRRGLIDEEDFRVRKAELLKEV